ncbi:hypothetical protein CKM354_000941000 [Cercospora kikuchii]|uniref:TauD/TfdA-like domain-containing protein n=1 Tax=Cercospora kikuchii TaxID=84275 RepID=A0A9P3FG62_9PEZI|nr:uncharacterized protein CKM354_000941000 [Cercospora kikuchii]GIZ46278.1 hypothetical protein CKM354_000941000 [Cercospora kikuchii]
MAPIAIEPVEVPAEIRFPTKSVAPSATVKLPLINNGSLDNLEQFDVTPVIGTEFPEANLVDMLNAPNADELLTELALTISQRGVVFFRKQDNLTNELQKQLITRLGELSGKPESSGLHVHPVFSADGNHSGQADKEISTISSRTAKDLFSQSDRLDVCAKKQSSFQWHTDIAFEKVPASYSSLRLTELPKSGGDTLWASGYELYDRLSPAMQQFFEGKTCTYAVPGYNRAAKRGNFDLYSKPRGSPLNVGTELRATHPVVRTNPITGWKSLYALDCQQINGLTKGESNLFCDWLKKLIVDNHDLQVRLRWKNPNDIAIWDNRSTFHNATYDYFGLGDRFGNRAVGLAEVPYYDPNSKSRWESLEGSNIGKYLHMESITE